MLAPIGIFEIFNIEGATVNTIAEAIAEDQDILDEVKEVREMVEGMF